MATKRMIEDPRYTVPAAVAVELRKLLPVSAAAPRARHARQRDIARWLGLAERSVQHWEANGAPAWYGWALVGCAFRFRVGEDALLCLAQADLDGSNVWGPRS